MEPVFIDYSFSAHPEQEELAQLQLKNSELEAHVAVLQEELDTAKGLLREGRYQELCKEFIALEEENARLREEKMPYATDAARLDAYGKKIDELTSENTRLREQMDIVINDITLAKIQGSKKDRDSLIDLAIARLEAELAKATQHSG